MGRWVDGETYMSSISRVTVIRLGYKSSNGSRVRCVLMVNVSMGERTQAESF